MFSTQVDKLLFCIFIFISEQWDKVWLNLCGQISPKGGLEGYSESSLGRSLKAPKIFSEGKPEAKGKITKNKCLGISFSSSTDETTFTVD